MLYVGLREVHSALGKLAKVDSFDMYMRIVREQQIPNINVVIKVNSGSTRPADIRRHDNSVPFTNKTKLRPQGKWQRSCTSRCTT